MHTHIEFGPWFLRISGTGCASTEKSLLQPCVSGMSEACSLNVHASKCLLLYLPIYLFKKCFVPVAGGSSHLFSCVSFMYFCVCVFREKLKTVFGAGLTWSAEFPVMGAALPQKMLYLFIYFCRNLNNNNRIKSKPNLITNCPPEYKLLEETCCLHV